MRRKRTYKLRQSGGLTRPRRYRRRNIKGAGLFNFIAKATSPWQSKKGKAATAKANKAHYNRNHGNKKGGAYDGTGIPKNMPRRGIGGLFTRMFF